MNAGDNDGLAAWGKTPDADLALLDVLWALAALEKAPTEMTAAQLILAEMQEKIPEGDFSLVEQRGILSAVIHQDYSFATDAESALPENINLATVIARCRGLPVAIGALYFALAHNRGWTVQGINFPGHFLIQLGQGQQRLLIDPSNGDELQAHDLRRLLKDTLGVHAELQHNHYQIVSPRQWVIRFYNNKKTALINHDRLHDALHVTEDLLQVAPYEPRLFYDAAVLATRLDRIKDAITYWDKFIILTDNKTEKEEAKYILSRLQGSLQ
jgi:regulator of sirC expression with transglutaminase-like and TPR domain